MQANVDAIMTFANVTSRGKNLMLRDLERMCKNASNEANGHNEDTGIHEHEGGSVNEKHDEPESKLSLQENPQEDSCEPSLEI